MFFNISVALFVLAVIGWIVTLFFVKKSIVPMLVATIFINIFNLLIQMAR